MFPNSPFGQHGRFTHIASDILRQGGRRDRLSGMLIKGSAGVEWGIPVG